MKLLKNFFYDFLDIDPTDKYYIGLMDRLEVYGNEYSKEYFKKVDLIYEKYKKLYKKEESKNTDENKLLKYEIDDYNNFKIFSLGIRGSQKYEYNTKMDLIPLSNFNNTIVFFIEFMTTFYKIRDKKDLENLNKIFVNYLSTFNDLIRLLKKGIEEKIVLSKFSCKIVIEQLEDLIKSKDYIIKVDKIYKNDKIYLEYLNNTIPKYLEKLTEFLNFLKTKYLPNCNSKIGYLNLPDGKRIYQALINSTLTSSKYSAERIHKLGLEEVKKLKNEINKVKNKLGHKDKSYEEFNQYMLNESKYEYKNKKDMLKDFNKLRKFVKKEVTDKLFIKDVNKDYEIRTYPKQFESGSALASYYPLTFHTAKNQRKGIFYLNAENMNDHKVYNTLTLSIHEASPGHHYQHAYPMMYKIPLYKNYIGNNNCYAEGWALYTETLYDYQQKDDEYHLLSYYGHLIFGILRANRLVVDTGINHYGWSYKKGFNYMRKNIPITDSEIHRELERYISIPTQAISYYIGKLIFQDGFKEFQKKNKRLNNKYSEEDLYKKYHHFCLKDGNIPMEILQQKIKDYDLK
tara:strand:- start:2376 stop:4085 length:1710 start_codon:yes stop_codon:yes gene_type:complete